MFLRLISFFILFFLGASLVHGKPVKVCGPIHVLDGELKLNDNEKVLVCGSKKSSEGWEDVQILQNLGYLEPRFERLGQQLHVYMGKRAKIKSLSVSDKTGILDPTRKRKVIGEALTTQKLNEVEAWSNIETQSTGYACAENTVTAQAWDGTIKVNSTFNGRKKMSPVYMTHLSGLDSDVLERYQPFEEGDWFDIRKTQIMANRLLSDGLFQSAYFSIRCREDLAVLQLETSVGKPKILRFGIGASTEEFPFLDLSFRNARLDDKASSYTASFHASPREVSITGTSELYIFPGWNRTFLGPRFRIAKEIENAWETNTVKAGVDIGRNWDLWDLRFNGRWGPTLNYAKTVKGVGPSDVTYPTIEGSLAIMSHVYEYLIRDQYEGWAFNLNYRGQNKGLGSQLDMNRYRAVVKQLWNLGGFSPPKFILGTRVEATIVDADDVNRNQNRDLLPIDDRIFLGGDQNLRGFARNSLDNNDLGYLTAFYIGFELRLIEELPFRLQPFLLWDMAQVGNKRYAVDQPVFSSQGLGLRWASPFGTLRGSAAQGQIFNEDESTQNYKEEWVIFLSFGQEF